MNKHLVQLLPMQLVVTIVYRINLTLESVYNINTVRDIKARYVVKSSLPRVIGILLTGYEGVMPPHESIPDIKDRPTNEDFGSK